MENTENKPVQNMVGHLYGSRISKNGKWLNVTIVATINGKDEKICVPVRMESNAKDGKPFAKFHLGEHPLNGELDKTKAMILCIPVYDGTKKAEDDGLPF